MIDKDAKPRHVFGHVEATEHFPGIDGNSAAWITHPRPSPTGHKAGIVGRNRQIGKTSLFRLIRGEWVLDSGIN